MAEFRGTHLASGLIGGLIAIVMMAALPVLAGNGDYMVAGEKTNATRATKLTSRGGLHLNVGKPGKPALTLNVVAPAPPLVVNSDGLVDNLNADLLDGKEAAEFASVDEVVVFHVTTDVLGDMVIASHGDLSLVLRCEEASTDLVWINAASSGIWYLGTSTLDVGTTDQVIIGSATTSIDTVVEGLGTAYTVAGELMVLAGEETYLGHDNANFGSACFAAGAVVSGP